MVEFKQEEIQACLRLSGGSQKHLGKGRKVSRNVMLWLKHIVHVELQL